MDETLTPLKNMRTRRSAVADQLRMAIIRGHLKPGSMVREVELAANLGVSATPVREALQDLAKEGLIVAEAHRFRKVADLDPAAFLDLIHVQSMLWRTAYIWAFPKLGRDELEQLEATIAAIETALAEGDTLRAVYCEIGFHAIIVQATGNAELVRVTLDRLSLLARFTLLHETLRHDGVGPAQHRAILDALRRASLVDALELLDALIAALTTSIRQLLPSPQ